jgi:hypothetical protein
LQCCSAASLGIWRGAAIGLGPAMRDNPQLNAGETLTWVLLLSLGLWALLWVAVSLLAA